MYALATKTHSGNSITIHCRKLRLRSITTATTYPAIVNARGKMAVVRQAIVQVTIMNTAAARAAMTNRNENASERTLSRPRTSSAGAASKRLPATRLASTAAAAQYIATNRNPLPRNTEAKNWSSRAPMRDRMTPMNHRNAMPANGAR